MSRKTKMSLRYKLAVFFILICAGTASVAWAQNQENPAPVLSIQEKTTLILSSEKEPVAERLPDAQVKDSKMIARLQSLNKVTARADIIQITPNTIAGFGNLEILMVRCWKSPPEEKPEAAALMQIWEKRPNELRKQIFFGWMFASSPAVSALEHAVYDIRVLDCLPPIEKSE